MSAEEIDAIAARVVALLRETETVGEVLTRAQAMTLTNRRSHGAFSSWCRRWRVKPAFRGRYSRTQLNIALGREGRARV